MLHSAEAKGTKSKANLIDIPVCTALTHYASHTNAYGSLLIINNTPELQ